MAELSSPIWARTVCVAMAAWALSACSEKAAAPSSAAAAPAASAVATAPDLATQIVGKVITISATRQ